MKSKHSYISLNQSIVDSSSNSSTNKTLLNFTGIALFLEYLNSPLITLLCLGEFRPLH